MLCYYLCQEGYVFTPDYLLFVCLSACLLSVNRITQTTDQIFMKFYGILGCNPGISRLDFAGNPCARGDTICPAPLASSPPVGAPAP